LSASARMEAVSSSRGDARHRPVTPCPVCGGRSGTTIYSVTSEVAARIFAPDLEEPLRREVQRSIERIWAGPSCDFVRCDQCTFCYAEPFNPATPEFYASLYSATEAYAESKWEFERTMRAIETLVQSGRLAEFSLVDIGAGSGAFASRASNAFSGIGRILCTEYSESGREQMRARGLTCLSGGLMDIDVVEFSHCFDILCLFQVLEHLADVDAVFDRLSVLATDGAHLFIAVPNYQQRSYFDGHGFHEDMPPVHVARWNRRSLEIAAERHGWRVEEGELEPEPYSSKLKRFAWQFYIWDPGVRRLGRVRRRHVRRALRATLIALFVLRSVPSVLDLRSRDMGTAYWVHLSRR